MDVQAVLKKLDEQPLANAHADQQFMLIVRSEHRDSDHLAAVVNQLVDKDPGKEQPK